MPDSTLKILRFGSCHFVMKDEIQNYEQILSRALYFACGKKKKVFSKNYLSELCSAPISFGK